MDDQIGLDLVDEGDGVVLEGGVVGLFGEVKFVACGGDGFADFIHGVLEDGGES